MDDTDAVDALERLGLTSYEARVFVALQKLGVGSASDVDRIADVPRSQVYGAADRLEDRGLVEVQQSNPIRYRPVDLEEARTLLRRRFEREQDRAFDVLEAVRAEHRDGEERQEEVWTVHGRDSVASRAERLVRDAGSTVVVGVGEETLEAPLAESLAARAAEGIDVTVVTSDAAVADRFAAVEGVVVHEPPAELAPGDRRAGRFLLVDGDTVLLSVLGAGGPAADRRETAIWSSDTGFAAVLGQLIESRLDGGNHRPS